MNNSKANRICFENFEYPSNTDFSSGSIYSDTGFTSIVKDFNDIDFDNTNNTYKSKYLEVTSTSAGLTYYDIFHRITTDLNFDSCRQRMIIKISDLSYYYFNLYFSDSNSIYYTLNIATRALTVGYTGGGGIILASDATFLPTSGSYQYLYIEYDKIYPLTAHTIKITIIAYNQNGAIILRNDESVVMENYKDKKVVLALDQFGLSSSSKKFQIVGLDYNFISDRNLKYQNAFINPYYLAYDLKQFYVTEVPYYNPNLKFSGTSKWYYATTIFQNRYLRYLTNTSVNSGSDITTLTDDFNEICANSFSMKFELSVNGSTTKLFALIFNHSVASFSYSSSSGLLYINGSFFVYNLPIDDHIFVHAQFKNNILSLSFYVNKTFYQRTYYVNDVFESLSIQYFRVVNAEIKPLTTESTMNYQNSSLLNNIFQDTIHFRNRISVISIYKTFNSLIVIPDRTVESLYDNNGRLFTAIYSSIIKMHFYFRRDSENGIFSITADNEYILSVFDMEGSVTSGKTYELTDNLLSGKTTGNLYLKSVFYTSSSKQVTVNVTIDYSLYVVYSDEIPENNLFINKALEIMIPFLIIGLIVVGFKSNSDSKYMGFVGLYVGIFVFYLMDYMSLLFMILCFIFETIGLYLIVKHEKRNGEI